MPAARSSTYQGSRLKKPNTTGILNNRERGTKATGTWSSSSRMAPTKTFDCMFCHRKGSVHVELDKKAHRGELECKVCGLHFQTRGPALYDHVDVHTSWIDACDAVEEQAEKERARKQQEALKLKEKDKLVRQKQHQHRFKLQKSAKTQQPKARLQSPLYIDLTQSDGLDDLFE